MTPQALTRPSGTLRPEGDRRVLVTDAIDEAGLEALFPVATLDVRPTLSPQALLEIIGDYDALMVRSQTQVTAEVLEAGTRLRVVGRAGVGLDNIDVAAARQLDVAVVNSPGGNTVAAAEHTLGLMFALSRHIAAADASVKRGEWQRSRFVGSELHGKTLGILGLGKIGSRVAMVARSLGMRVLAHDPHVQHPMTLGVERESLEQVLGQADYLTIHLPKTPETTHLLNADAISKLKRGARIINCARGGLVDEEALIQAIEQGHIAGAALDVFEGEPQVREALRRLGQRVILTPHLGASTEEAQRNVAIDVAEQMASILATPPAPVLPGQRFISKI